MKIRKKQNKKTSLRRKYEELLLIQKISKKIVSNLDFEEVSQFVVDSIVKELHFVGGVIFVIEEDSNGKQLARSYTFSNTGAIRAAIKPVRKIFRELTTSVDQPENYVGEVIKNGEAIVSNDVSDFISPPVEENTARLMQKAARVKSINLTPIQVYNKRVGALMFVSKQGFEKSDNEMIEIFADQIGVALENARLYSQVQDQVSQLDAKTKDLSSLLEITETAISSLDPEEVAQNIVDAVPTKLAHLDFMAGLMIDYDEKTDIITPKTITNNKLTERALKMLGQPISAYTRKLSQEDPKTFISRSIRTKTIQMSDKLEEFISPNVSHKTAQAIQKTLGIGAVLSVPMIVRGEVVGTFVFFAKRNPNTITDRERNLATAFASNMSLAVENARFYRIIQEKAAELEEKNEYLKALDETKTNFLSIASHQLRTPISGVKGYLAMLRDGDFGELTDKQHEVIGLNLKNIERLITLIDTFLNVSRIEAKKLKLEKAPTDITSIIDSVIEELSGQIKDKDLALVFERPRQELPKLHLDEEKFRHVVFNLIDNAIKYTNEGRVTVYATQEGENVLIEVQDTGIGLKPGEAKKLFEKFVRAGGGMKTNANGSGLGLYIIRKMVEAHKGRTWVESDGEGKGSSFFVELPILSDMKKSDQALE